METKGFIQFEMIINEMKSVFRHQDLKMFYRIITNMINFHPLEVVGRGSETQLQVGEN